MRPIETARVHHACRRCGSRVAARSARAAAGPGVGRVAAAIAKVRKYQPAAYMKICALLVPREMKLEHSGGVKAMTDEQIEQAIEAIEELIAKREAGANAKR